jgi:hypothetical protein
MWQGNSSRCNSPAHCGGSPPRMRWPLVPTVAPPHNSSPPSLFACPNLRVGFLELLAGSNGALRRCRRRISVLPTLLEPLDPCWLSVPTTGASGRSRSARGTAGWRGGEAGRRRRSTHQATRSCLPQLMGPPKSGGGCRQRRTPSSPSCAT